MVEVEGENQLYLVDGIHSKFKDLHTNGIYSKGMENCVCVKLNIFP